MSFFWLLVLTGTLCLYTMEYKEAPLLIKWAIVLQGIILVALIIAVNLI